MTNSTRCMLQTSRGIFLPKQKAPAGYCGVSLDHGVLGGTLKLLNSDTNHKCMCKQMTIFNVNLIFKIFKCLYEPIPCVKSGHTKTKHNNNCVFVSLDSHKSVFYLKVKFLQMKQSDRIFPSDRIY